MLHIFDGPGGFNMVLQEVNYPIKMEFSHLWFNIVPGPMIEPCPLITWRGSVSIVKLLMVVLKVLKGIADDNCMMRVLPL